MNAIQLYETANSQSEAEQMLAFCMTQVNAIGGRLLEPSPAKPSWRVQAFFADEPDVHDSDLALVGLRRVLVPESQQRDPQPLFAGVYERLARIGRLSLPT